MNPKIYVALIERCDNGDKPKWTIMKKTDDPVIVFAVVRALLADQYESMTPKEQKKARERTRKRMRSYLSRRE